MSQLLQQISWHPITNSATFPQVRKTQAVHSSTGRGPPQRGVHTNAMRKAVVRNGRCNSATPAMQPSIFNVRVPLRDQSDVFLMNTLTDAQIIAPPTVVSLLDSLDGARHGPAAPRRPFDEEEREALATLTELGFVVDSHDADRRALDAYFDDVRQRHAQLRLTVLTTLQCNFACDYCFQGDHDDHNRHAHKMSLETAARGRRARRAADGRVRPEKLVGDVLRRRAAAQPAGRLLPRRARPRRRHGPRRPPVAQHHHQRPAAHARTSSIACCRSA